MVRARLDLDTPAKNGSTKRKKLEETAARTGRLPPDLANEPEAPPAAEHLLDIFHELDAARTSSGFGLNPVSFAEIDAWSRLSGRPLRGWEVSALRAMDCARLSAAAAKGGKADKEPTTTVAASDGAGVRGLFKGMGAKKRS